VGGIAGLRLLLDTHIWLWLALEPSRLGQRVQKELTDPESEKWLSPISAWEALLLHRKGRINLEGDCTAWVSEASSLFLQAPLTHEIVLAAERVPLESRDPADRFIAATAYVLDLTLVTADRNLLGLGEISTLANR
jgi:PIN domain nuclease of toxin-antitoxin system